MLENLQSLLLKSKGLQKRAIIAGANDSHVLEAVKNAEEQKIITPILIGERLKIQQIAKEINYNILEDNIIDISGEVNIAKKAIEMMHNDQADILIKGLINTAVILKWVLNKDYNLNLGKVLSHVALMEIPGRQKLLFITDAALNILPDIEQKSHITENVINLARKLGYEKPKVAIISSNEKVSEKLISSVDAAIISKMGERNSFGSCVIDGPLALDIAISKEALDLKGICSPVDGDADILVLPNIDAANALYKSLIYFAKAETAGVIVGSRKPVVVTSRADSAVSKLYSIALATLL
ncbi:MAG: bifunctional enoyl-CoA hydratase/phosphate acetyltransferase [Spirochaetales bacterium]|jgi:phosphate butyryltransferase|nr:bifunctional enoyl-CoA hydratase/phosphate acetyltransferase [Exilispira sp.]NMC66942.1 bifunctional enoyl-CoA hydratase/phosphate acetyltransferase [Spirochaetales bacterium]